MQWVKNTITQRPVYMRNLFLLNWGGEKNIHRFGVFVTHPGITALKAIPCQAQKSLSANLEIS